MSFIRSHIGFLTPAAQDRRVKGCWQVLIAKKTAKNKAWYCICFFFIFLLSPQLIFHTLLRLISKQYFYFCIQTQMGVIKLFHNGVCCSLSAVNLNFLFAQALQWSTQINVFVQKYPFLCLEAYQHSEKCFILFYHMPALYFSLGALNLIIYWDIGRKKNSLLEHLCHTWINLDWMCEEIAVELFFCCCFFQKTPSFP